MILYNDNKYSLPTAYIGKTVEIKIIDNNLYIYYNKKYINIHHLFNKNNKLIY